MGCGRAAALAPGDLDGRGGELDPVLVEELLDPSESLAADHELLAGLGHQLAADLHRVVAELLDTLHLERLDDVPAEFRVRLQLLPDRLDDLAGALEIAVVGDADRELVDHPVAAHVLHCPELAEGHRVYRPSLVPELDGAQRERLDRALVRAALDVLADPKGVV